MGDQRVRVVIEGDNLLSADLRQIESEFVQVERAGKKTATTVSSLFTSIGNEQFSVQANWQRAMNDIKAATEKAVADANKEIAALGKNVSSDRLSASFKDLGIKSALDIEREKTRLIAAFQAIKRSGVASADEIRRAEKALQDQLNKLDGALDENKKSVDGIATGLKGVVVWLAAAFTVDRVVAFAKAAFDASLAVDAITGKLKVMTGSDQAAAEELAFIRVEANRLGLDLLETAKSYGSFMTAVKGTANEGKMSRAAFMGITEGMNAVRMSAEEQSRAWAQLNQGIMKGKFEMEDLKTINEAGLPIFKLLADALGVSTKELMRMQSEGRLLADDVLPKLGESMHKTYGDAAAEAAGKGRAELNKFNTVIFELKAYLAQSVDVGGFGFFTGIIEGLKSIILYSQLGKIHLTALFEKFSAIGDNGGLPSLILGGKEARDDLRGQFEAIDAMTEYSIKKRKDQYKQWSSVAEQAEKEVATTAKNTAMQTAADVERAGQIRRDNAKKGADDLAKINVEYAKQTGDAEAQLTADMLKQYEDRKKATIDYWTQKKAFAKDDIEEASYEIIKNQKLQQIEAQHLRDIEVIQAASKSRRLDALQDELALETLLVQEKIAKQEITVAQGERRITELTVASAKAQYDAKKEATQAYVDIYGEQGENYKKLMKDQEAAHKEFLSSSLTAYKQYADNIKAIDAEIKNYRESMQAKIADLQQRTMTDGQKYADNQLRYDQLISKSRAALAAKDYDLALKYNQQAEEMATRLADKQAEGNSEIEKQAALQQGVANATAALNQVEGLGLEILQAKKQENQDALTKLQEIQNMKLDPKALQVNMDQSALSAVQSALDKLSEPATKIINVVYQSSGSAPSGETPGYFDGGKIGVGSSLRDSVHALLAKGEWVINNKATGFWGDGLMAAINAPFSAAGQKLQQALSFAGPTPAVATPMGSIDLNIGGGSFAVQAPINVLGELTTALRRMKMTRPQ